MTSFHVRHSELLANLATPSIIDELMGSAVASWSITWSRIVDPHAGRVNVLVEASGRTQQFCLLDIASTGPVTMTWFPTDPALPTLSDVLAKHRGARVVRYRPGKRCTLSTRQRFIKVFTTDQVTRFHEEGQALWRASQRGELAFAVAPSLGADIVLRTHTQGAVAGQPIIDELYSSAGSALAERLGAACASIPTSSLQPTADLSASAELARTVRRASEIASYVPDLTDAVGEFVSRLEELHDRFEPQPLRAIHGSPHPNQWLLDGDTLGLVDFDRLSSGDPELDVATFLGEVDFESSPHRSDIASSFIDGYQRRYGDLDPDRLMAYRAHKRFAKVYRTVRSIRPDADQRAAAHLETAWATFGVEVVR